MSKLKFLFFFGIGLIAFACSDETSTEKDSDQKIVELDVLGKAFDAGSAVHYVDSTCSFFFECDCCADEIIFKQDSSFTFVAHCEREMEVLTGVLLFKENKHYLLFSGESSKSITDMDGETTWEYKSDKPFEREIHLTNCGNKLHIIFVGLNNRYYGIEQGIDAKERLKALGL